MKFVVIFEDARDVDPDIRKKHMKEHIGFLDSNTIEAAGPLSDNEGKGRDGLWIVEAAVKSDVETLVRSDPFWSTGLRASYAILPWTQVYAGGQSLIAP